MIAVSDPAKLMVLDEISGLLGKRVVTRVATLSQITDLLKKTEQSQRVLDEASEGLAFDVLSASDERGREHLDREADVGRGHQPDHPAGGHDDFHGAGAAGVGYSH